MTAENPFRLEAEKVDLSLRYHHLEWLSGYTIAFYEEFGNPWAVKNISEKVAETSLQFNAKATETMLESVGSLSSRIFDPFRNMYLRDVYGKAFDQVDVVTQKRGDYFLRVIDGIIAEPEDYLKLTGTPDGICDSCAVGKHCSSTYPGIIKPLGDSDFITKHSLVYLSRRKFKGVRTYEKAIINEGNAVYVANKVLFEKKFYVDLTKEIRKRFLTAVDFKYWNSIK